MPETWLTALLGTSITFESSSSFSHLCAFLFILAAYLFYNTCSRYRRQNERMDWPYAKLDRVGRVGRRQIIEEVRLTEFPSSIEQIFEILDPKSSRILWINESTFVSINGWSIHQFIEDPDIHRMLALDFTCSRRNGPWKRIHIYSRSFQTAFEVILLLMDLEHQFNTVDICYNYDISESDAPLNMSALTPAHIQAMLTVKPNCDNIEVGFEGLRFDSEQSAALAKYSRSLNLGHDTTVDGKAFIAALRKREDPVHSLKFRERPFDDVSWRAFLAHLAECDKIRVRSLTLFHGCFVGPQDCPLLMKAQVERLDVQCACFHDEGDALVRAVATGKCPPHLQLSGYQPDMFTWVVNSLSDDACTLKSLWISLSVPHDDARLRAALEIALAKNRSLEALTIDNVSDMSEWVQTFAPLVTHQSLKKLALNDIEQTSHEAAQNIVRLLESNRNLEILYSFSGSARKQCRDAWDITIESTQSFNRFVKKATPFCSDSRDHYREAIFNAALARNRHDSRRLAILLFQNADLLANLKPVSDARQKHPLWNGCKAGRGLARFYQLQQQRAVGWMHAFREHVQSQADDLGYRIGDVLIFSSFGWARKPENGSIA